MLTYLRTHKPWASWIVLIPVFAFLRPETIPYPVRALIGLVAFVALIRVCIYMCQPWGKDSI